MPSWEEKRRIQPKVGLKQTEPVLYSTQFPLFATLLAGYAQISNAGRQPAAIVRVTSDVFSAVEIHETLTADGIARMRPTGVIRIPAGKTVTLKPGGLYFMLMQPSRDLASGDTVGLVFHFEDNGSQGVTFKVERR